MANLIASESLKLDGFNTYYENENTFVFALLKDMDN